MKTMTKNTKNVLVCEDDPVQLKILTTLINQAGYTPSPPGPRAKRSWPPAAAASTPS